MIQKKVIDTIYKKYRRRPASPDELDIPLLFEQLPLEAGVEIEGPDIVLSTVDSPFHSIPVSNINAILNFDEAVAIVLPASLIFINKEDGNAWVHIKDIGLSFVDRLKTAVGF